MIKNKINDDSIPFQNENSDSSSDLIEKCLGFISLGKNVTGEKEKAQWFSVMSAPRKVGIHKFFQTGIILSPYLSALDLCNSPVWNIELN